MPLSIREYDEKDVDAVRRFNQRLNDGGEPMHFSLSPVPRWLPKIHGRRLFQEYFLAKDETGAVRGAYILKHQDFWVKGQVLSIGDLQLPISEGVVNPRYAFIGVQLLRDVLRRQPLLFSLGMGGYEEAMPRLLKAGGWTLYSVPFFFRVVHPAAFLRNIKYLRRRVPARVTLNLLALSGLGWLGIHGVQALFRRSRPPVLTVEVEPVPEFDAWADELWQAGKGDYGMSAVRDAETLRILYPREKEKFIRLRVSERSRTIGWAVLLSTPLANHKQFGNMRLGSIVDGFASAEDATKIIAAARAHLESLGVDLIVSNQSHAAWRQGLHRAGFFQGPSNYIFASSPKLKELLHRQNVNNEDLHITRGDGDGPNNL